MTLAPAPPQACDASHASQTSTQVTTVTAVLLVPAGSAGVEDTLDSLARQTRAPERLVVLAHDEAVAALARDHEGLRGLAPTIRHVGLGRGASMRESVRQALGHHSSSPPQGVGPTAIDAGAPGDSAHGRDATEAPERGAATEPAQPAQTLQAAQRPQTAQSAQPPQPPQAAQAAAGDVSASTEVEHLWFLTAGSVPGPTALGRLLEALRRSPSVAIAGPKLLQRERPRALQAVGIHTTRTGRIIASPAAGEPDQGQYDRRTDVLAVPLDGMLVERELFERLGGHDPAFGALGGDLDLCWRAQQAGRRVIVVPRASVHVPADDTATGVETPALRRRQARRVALTRCSLVAAPFLALWIGITAVLGGLGLLVLKRPRAAWAELADLPSVLDPWRTVAARWRSRGTRSVRRKDLRGVFVTRRAVLRHAGDLVHDHVGLDAEPREDLLQPTAALESGPVADEAQDLNLMAASWAARAARNPGLLAVVLATAVSVAAGRHVGGSLGRRLDTGLAGGELLGTRADAGALWHSWLDGWHGSGLGFAGEQGPHLAVLAGLAWVVEHLPGITAPASPAGAVVATLVGAALPLATLTAYLAGRVVTRSRWPRALAALAWATTSVLATAVGAGRLGALVAVALLPLVAAGFALAARRGGSTTATAANGIATAVLASFMPAMLAVTTVSALMLLVLGRGTGPRLRGVALLVLPAALLGPWLPTLLRDPYLLLSGPGLTVWGDHAAQPWELALLDPSGTPLRALVAAPLVLAGVLGLLRAGRRSSAATCLMVTALAGLALALAAPRVVLGATPKGAPHPGSAITAWPGTGLLLYALALLAAALLGSAGLPIGRSAGGWRAATRWPVAALVVASVALSAGWISWKTVGDDLRAWAGPRPAVAIDQGHGPLANRMLVLQPVKGVIRYELLGREVSGVARDLPLPGADRPDGDALAAAVAGIFAPAGSTESQHAADSLVDQGIGFVGIRTGATDPTLRTLDATAGLSRLGEHDGVLFWRVLPPAQPKGQPEPVGPSRVRVVTPDGATGVPVTGDHSRLSATLPAREGATLVVAEPQDWLAHARVAVDRQVLQPKPGSSQPTFVLPRAGGHLTVEVLPTEQAWRWAQGGLLAVLAFLAIPIGRRRERRAS